ncbi:MAG: AAA family ATPase [Dehalococcoidia bacterium]|nr:AAA family ATPase [Dehalococcoidia bacterium]
MSKLKHQQPPIELNDDFKRALDLMEHTHQNVFITGRAGTGKSTLLSYFRGITQKKVVVLAPTGVAALNVEGQTIHSFFRFKPNITLDRIRKARFRDDEDNVYKKLEAIVIDEISMVRADLLDCVDKFLQLNGPRQGKPFGGIQMIFFGDLYQLSPVVTSTEKAVFTSIYQTPYFYGAKVFDSLEMDFIELEKVYRQHDERFLSLLNSVRNNSIGEDGLQLLNRRHMPAFEPSPDDFYVYLTTTNQLADQINGQQLAKLDGNLYTFSANVQGQFGNEYLPTAIDLQVKAGAQIMMVNNDPGGRWVNGSIGKIREITHNKKEDTIVAEVADDEIVEIAPYTWEIFRFFAEEGQLQSEVVGRFKQYPLMLAWAVTIHKSQGKTLEKVIVDIGRGTFAYGQVYVALSRCTTLEGIVLKKPILKKHIWTDYKMVDFLTKYQYRKAEQSCSVADKVETIKRAITNKTALHIVYLKPNDVKSKRIIRPETVGEMEYGGKKFLGMRAFCLKRNEERVFRVDRVLEIEEA